MAATIEITGLRVDRGGATVLHDLTLDVEGGVVTGLLGPSGSGKSTLMRSIVGVQVVAAGNVRVLGLPAGTPALRSRVGYVTQSPAVYGDLSVRENLTYFARVLGAPRARVDEVIERVGLATWRLISSAGSRAVRRRVSRSPPHSWASPTCSSSTSRRSGSTRCSVATSGTSSTSSPTAAATLLVSSHVMDEAARCDRLLLLREGQILADLAPDALLRSTGAPDLDAAFLRLVEEGPAG